MTEKEIMQDEQAKNEKISKGYAQIYADIEALQKELEKVGSNDVYKLGYLKSKIALLNKKKKTFEKTYFNY